MTANSIYFNGFKFEERRAELKDLPSYNSDVAVFVANWEARSKSLIGSDRITGRKAIILNFKDSGVSEDENEKLKSLASESFDEVELFECADPMEHEAVMSNAEALVRKISEVEPVTCLFDYTALPKVVTQTLFRKFMIEGLCPRSRWLYLSGLYDNTPAVSEDFNQGCRKFFTIRGASGNGGISRQRVGIVAMGADRPLIDSFLREANYDELHFVYAYSRFSPSLMDKILEQIKWLKSEHGVSESDVHQCEATTVSETLEVFSEIMKSYPDSEGAAIDLFCCGPKSHAIAAAALVNVHANVRLVGRSPSEYNKFDVKSTGEVSVSIVTDYTNPRIADALLEVEN